VKYNQF